MAVHGRLAGALVGKTLQRLLGPVRALDRGQYTTETATGRPAVCCPSCGDITELDETHRVLPGGLVSPIWMCSLPSCGFADFLVLEAADEDVLT